MDKFPLLWEGKPLGELTAERETGSAWFEARCRLPEGKGLWCVWIVGDRGELRLGVLEPAGGRAVLRRRFSDRMTQPIGRPLRGELRGAVNGSGSERWERAALPERLFRTPWLRQRLRGAGDVLIRREDDRLYLAFPYDKGSPFPLVPLFCFGRLRTIRESVYIVYGFDRRELPLR